MRKPLLTLRLRTEHDVVLARQRARRMAELLGFDMANQTRLATAVSEVARNAFQYASEGRVEFRLRAERVDVPAALLVEVEDEGPGIPDLAAILSGNYTSPHGMGLGILGARRLMKIFEISSREGGGTSVVLGVALPPGAELRGDRLVEILDTLAQETEDTAFGEILLQNQELLRIQADLADANRRLAEADAGKDRFLAMIGHELRNQLASLRSADEVRRRQPDPETQREMEELSRQQLHHMSRLVDDLLDASRLSRGQMTVRPEVLDLGRELAAAVDGERRSIEAAGLRLVLEKPSQQVPVRGDRTRLAQILSNLLSNARKFTDPGGTVTVRIVDTPPQGPTRGSAKGLKRGEVRFEVQDTGCGLSSKGLDLVLKPFFQTEEARRRMTGGLGLGLPIVQGLVEAQGGRLEVHSDGLGRGSTFAVVLPRSSSRALITSPSRAIAAEKLQGEGADETASTSLRILVIDDYRPSAVTLGHLLTLEGHSVEIASRGEEALEIADRQNPQLVFCDLGLPGMDGFQVAKELRRREPFGNTPLYAISGFADAISRRQALEAGFNDHLAKPLAIEILQEIVHRHS